MPARSPSATLRVPSHNDGTPQACCETNQQTAVPDSLLQGAEPCSQSKPLEAVFPPGAKVLLEYPKPLSGSWLHPPISPGPNRHSRHRCVICFLDCHHSNLGL